MRLRQRTLRMLGSAALAGALFAADVVEMLDVSHSLNMRDIDGGTGPGAVAVQLEKARQVLEK